MRIEIPAEISDLRFCDIEEGDVFLWDNTVYMKTEHILSADANAEYNAVDLSNGELTCFDGLRPIGHKLNAKLVVEN